MIALPPSAGPSLERLLEMSWSAGILVLIVLAVQAAFGRWLTPRWRCALWGVVVVRLLLPVLPGSVFSVANLWSPAESQTASAAVSPQPAIIGNWSVGTLPSQATIPNTTAIAADVATDPPVATRDTPSTASRRLNGWLLAWAAGAALVLGRGVWLHVRLMRRVRCDARDACEATAQRFAQRCRAWRIRRPVALRVTDAVVTPTLAGLRRPAVLLPPRVADTFSDDELRHIFDHELAHLRCRDLAANWGLLLLTALHWFNPLIWFAFHRLRLDREPARDAMVLAQRETPPHPRAYGHTLLRVLELLQSTPHPSHPSRRAPAALSVSMSVAPRHARRRFGHLARPRAAGLLTRVLGGLLLVTLVVVGCTAPVQNETSTATPTPAAEPHATPEPAPILSPEETANAATRAKLAESIEINLTNARLEDAMDVIRQTSDVMLFVNWPALQGEGVGPDTPVNLTLNRTPGHKVLELILQAVSAASPGELGFTVREGVVTVSSRTDVRKATELRVYDIRDLMAPHVRFNIPPFRADGLVVEDPPDPEAIADPHITRDEIIDDLIRLIEDTVGRFDDWETHGGTDSIRELNANLIIKTTDDGHRQIVQLLDQLREGTLLQVSVETRVLMLPPDILLRSGITDALTPIPAQTPEEADTAWRFVTDVESNLLVETALAHRNAQSVTMPRLTVFNGQTGYVTNARQRSFVQDVEPVPGDNGFDITVGRVQDEFTVIATAGVARQDSIALQLDGRMVLVDPDFEERPIPGLANDPLRQEWLESVSVNGVTGVDGKVVIQTPRVEAWRARLNTTLPDRGHLIIVGPELNSALTFTGSPAPTAGPRRPVMLVSVTRIDPRTRNTELFPGITDGLLLE